MSGYSEGGNDWLLGLASNPWHSAPRRQDSLAGKRFQPPTETSKNSLALNFRDEVRTHQPRVTFETLHMQYRFSLHETVSIDRCSGRNNGLNAPS